MNGLSSWVAALRRLSRRPLRDRQTTERDESLHSLLHAFQTRAGVRFHDLTLLRRALTHRSYLGGEEAHGPESNERLEFLGDAVLELIVIEYLFQRFPLDREGELTQKKSVLVSRSVLADRAERLGLGRFILLSDAERGSGGSERRSILADGFEAILGGIYLDRGLEESRAFVDRWLLQQADRILRDTEKQNFKSILQELIQARLRVHPRYRVQSEVGPDHEKLFTVEVVVRGRVLGRGTGRNKKESEQMAAREALDSGEVSRWLREQPDEN
ncbi:MAG: ribonuclease III [Candidatus Eisenbacteria bacterium]|nr:ribonuclease III [Candidatus Eisenbacteria bacterium]